MQQMTCHNPEREFGSANRCPPQDAGYALIAMMITVAILLVSLTAALPSIYQAGQREREAEAIFCGQQYARAIYLFHRKFGRYPVSVKDLLNTDGTRFLRQPYRDPLNRNGRWRFIHAVAGGFLIDSWNQITIQPGAASGALPANSGTAGEARAASSLPGAGTTASNSMAENSSGTGQNGKPKHPPSTCEATQGESSDSSYQMGTLMGAFIAGVAPCSSRQSIRVLDHHDHYDHWEFLGLKYQAYSLPRASNMGTPVQPAMPGQVTPSNPQSNPTSSTGPGMPDTNTPPAASGQDNGSPDQ